LFLRPSLHSRFGRHDRQIENDSDLISGQIADRHRREHHNKAHDIAADGSAFASVATRGSKITAQRIQQQFEHEEDPDPQPDAKPGRNVPDTGFERAGRDPSNQELAKQPGIRHA
jgi:hypothetical protein